MPRLFLLCLVTAIVFGCAGRAPQPAPVAHDAAWLRGQLGELAALACPEGCSPADWALLKAGLAETIEQRLAGKAVSAPPSAESARPRVRLDPSGPYLTCYFNNPGDYNQDGVVSVSDLTPLGANLNQNVDAGMFGFISGKSVIDGDSNGQINISDLTPLGANLGRSIVAWHIFEAGDLSSYPAGGTGPSTTAAYEIRPMASSDGSPPEQRRFYIPAISPDVNKWYWMRGVDASGEGICSIPVGGGNLPPVISFAPSALFGAPPFTLSFDASGTTDPEGQAIEFTWALYGSGVYEGAQIDATWNTEGIWNCALFAMDEMGATSVQQWTVTSSLGAKWRIASPDPTHTLNFSDRIRVEELDTNVPAVAFTTTEGSADAIIYTRSYAPEGSDWETPNLIETLDGDLEGLDMAIVSERPALCWVQEPTGGPIMTLQCAQSNGTEGISWQTESVTATPSLSDPAICMAGGRAFIAYHDGDAGSLQGAQGNALDFAPWTISTIDASGFGGGTPTVGEINGAPAVFYRYSSASSHRYCSSTLLAGDAIWNTPVTAQLFGLGGLNTSFVRLDGEIPGYAHYDFNSGFIIFNKATDATATNFDDFTLLGTDMGDMRGQPAMTMVRNRPFLAYHQASTGQIFGAWANDQTGTSWEVEEISSDALADVPPDVSSVLDDYPVVAFVGADGTPRFGIYY